MAKDRYRVRSRFTSGGIGENSWSRRATATRSTISVNPTPNRLAAVKNFRRRSTLTAILR
jgi:hypothetical protein